MVQQPKDKGGLGVLNLRLQNDALLLKQLHKFYNRENIPWVQLIWNKYYSTKVPHAAATVGSFWWRDVLKLCTLYRGIASCKIGDGSSVTFFNDLIDGEILSSKFPRLFSFTSNPDISVQQIMLAEDLDSIFDLPLTPNVYDELLDLSHYIQSISFNMDTKDEWLFIWGNKTYSSQRYYKMVFQHVHSSSIFKKLWKSKCTPRLKFFAWLLFVDRLNTRSMLVRRNFNVQPNSLCVLYTTNLEEDLEHLFFSCPFATTCWQKLGFIWPSIADIKQRVLSLMDTMGLPFFMEIFIIATWEIWKLRNSKIFDNGNPTTRRWV